MSADQDTEQDTRPAAPKGGKSRPAPKQKPPESEDAAAKRAKAEHVATKKKAAKQAAAVAQPAAPARLRRRHRVIFVSFALFVILPMALAFWYLNARAINQYHSTMSFSVRKEQTNSSLDIVGGLSQLSGGSSSDTDVLYQFIQSQELVAQIDRKLSLRELYSTHYDEDPVFSLQPGATIEELIEYWPRMVRIHYDRGSGIIQVRTLSFDAETARAIARAILADSTRKINDLSRVAREDAMRYAREELDQAIARLTEARQAMTEFRLRTQIVDPFADLQGQMGLMNNLQAELATALIDLSLLRETASPNDPRITQAVRRVEVIRAQIAQERAKFGVGGEGPGGEDYATLVAEFERLNVDREFAEEAYRSALSAHDAALAEAQRQSRYLAAHIEPTLAESSEYPQRWLIMGITFAFLLVLWAIGILIYYSIRDRR